LLSIFNNTNGEQNCQCCKALILEKTGELEEAYALCKEVQAEKPTDPGVLNSLRAVFKSLGKCK